MDPSDVRGWMPKAICQLGALSCDRLESTRLPYDVSGGLKLGSRLGQLLFNV
ncbi:hypothetical protein PLICRDRAFT_46225 [Plicaturopsis crispa FD-325 SS-3]|uniref:Unplaced genomic scaffold PLICRscaffold_18, whole genome shotgun sequence n=1 Tax=Plicaturopsis crispa FD-325 SS-3 TaxID=944288 RepID=A0A0C9T4U9_PLICR|nr:hypothetical protein PLICRDRAFT_46225 [Plicaturopsis crispa FD-325 SS-3]